MYLQIILTQRDSDGSLSVDSRTSVRYDQFPVTLSGGDADGAIPADLPPQAMVIAGPKSPEDSLRLESLADGLELRYQDDPVALGSTLRNGGEYELGDHLHLRLVVGFPPVKHRARLAVGSGIVMALIVAVLLGQFVFILGVTKEVEVDSVFATEVDRQRVYAMLDANRDELERIEEENLLTDDLAQLTAQMLRDELDRQALFLREHGESLSREKLQTIFDDLQRLSLATRDLESGALPPVAPEINIAPTLNPLIEKDSSVDDAEASP